MPSHASGQQPPAAARPAEIAFADPALFNANLAPVPPERRTWGIYNYASLWVAMSVCIPTYMLASGLIAGGMNWWQAIGTILLGNLIVLVPMLLNAHAGAKYGIPFPVFVRASFGVRGANFPLFCARWWRADGSEFKPGSAAQAIHSMLADPLAAAGGLSASVWLCFVAFWLLNMVGDLARHRNHPSCWKASARRSCWASDCCCCGGSPQGRRPRARAQRPQQISDHRLNSSASSFLRSPAMVGFWATVALNIPDFTRFAKSQRAQMLGQALGLPPAMTLYSFIGVAVTSASVILFGEAIWDPVVSDRPLSSARGGLRRARLRFCSRP